MDNRTWAQKGVVKYIDCTNAAYRNKLLAVDKLALFYAAAHEHFPDSEIAAVVKYCKVNTRHVMLRGEHVMVKKAVHHKEMERKLGKPVYKLKPGLGEYSHIFYPLDEGYLFIPRNTLPAYMSGTTFTDCATSKYAKFRNRFDLGASVSFV